MKVSEVKSGGGARGPSAPAAYWRLTSSALLAALATREAGLTATAARERLDAFGPNNATTAAPPPGWLRFARRFANPLVIILIAASGLSALTGDVASFVIITGIVLISVMLDFVQETRAQSAVDALKAKVALKARVMRDGAPASLPVADLVPGDVVDLSAGDLAPADGVLLSGKHLFVNDALLTGEAFPHEKAPAPDGDPAEASTGAANAVLAGSSIVSGSARLLVCETGRRTMLGQLADTLITQRPPTSFETGVRRFSILILRITLVLVVLVMAESLAFHRPWLQSLLFALALAVGLTPELLPMIMTITLARGAIELSKRRVIVKGLSAIHNLGAMDVLCTDKTGTLTQAQIALERTIDADGRESERVFDLAWLNSHFESGLKSALDDAIMARPGPDAGAWRKIDEAPFDFERRRVSVLVERDGARSLILKGAPEDVLRLCVSVEAPGGAALPLDEVRRAAIRATFDDLGAQGYRLLGVASRPASSEQAKVVPADETDLTFAGFAVFRDPPKDSAGAALKALAASGVEVKVLTGDNELVAQHLCAELGFDPGEVVTGAELAAMSEEALIGRLGRTRLFCRVTPQQKLRVILQLKRLGQTVGYLGDGINDAPSLHAADVGVSVDAGADVAKAAAEIILLEQDLGVVHEGVLEGRRTIVNTSKYILMASSANFGNIFSMVLAGLILPFLPLLPIQVLLTNLIYDLAQTGLPLDNVDPEAIEKPIHWDIRLIRRFMYVMGPVSTLFDVATFFVLLGVFQAGEAFFRTGWFLESLVTQILMLFAVRTRRALTASRPGRVATLLAFGAAGFTLALPYLPGVADWFHFVRPPGAYFGFLAAAVIGFLVAIEAAKRLFYARLAPGARPRRSR